MRVFLDVDGVLGEYLPWLFKFFGRRLGCDPELWRKLEASDGAAVRQLLGLDLQTYDRLKTDYRLGPKWEMPAVEGMPAITHALKRNGFDVIVATTRSQECHQRTLDWLNRREFAFDDLVTVGRGMMGKYERVGYATGTPRDLESVIVVEDDFGAATAAGIRGWRPVLRNLPHNQRRDFEGRRKSLERQHSIERYDTSAELMELLLRLQLEYKEFNS